MTAAVPVHGSSARLYAGGYDISNAMQDANVMQELPNADATTWGAVAELTVDALAQRASLHGSGLFDTAVAGAHEMMAAKIAVEVVPTMLMFSDLAIGDYGVGLQGSYPHYEVKPALGAANDMQFDLLSNVGAEWLRTLHPLAAETTTFNGASLDNLAASSNGGAGYVQVTAFTGTSGVFKIQHSVDNSAWTDLVTFSTISATHTSERIAVAPGTTVKRYLRAACTADSFTTMTIAIGFCRA